MEHLGVIDYGLNINRCIYLLLLNVFKSNDVFKAYLCYSERSILYWFWCYLKPLPDGVVMCSMIEASERYQS